MESGHDRPMVTAATLATPVQHLLQNPHLEITEWEVQPLHASDNPTTEGLYLVRGQAADARQTTPWSLVLKVIRATDGQIDPTSPGYGEREALAYQSGVLHSLPPGVAVPSCFAITTSPGSIWLWLEEIDSAHDGAWPLARYGLAARHLGRFNGHYLVTRPCPTFPWLQRDFPRTWVAHGEPGISQLLYTASHPLVQHVYPAPVLLHMQRLWEQRGAFLVELARMPQTLCHMDTLRRNMIARSSAEGQEQTVLLDWCEAGIGALGEDLAGFVTGSVFLDPDTPFAPELEEIVLPAYVAGLRDVEWSGDEDEVRRGYAIAAALRILGGTTWVLDALRADSDHTHAEQVVERPVQKITERWAAATKLVVERLDEPS